jgi:colanic acid/amylovoran biosynthesis glycosyltransferase
MHDADAFLLPSRTAPCGDREGTPTVLVEAQAVGLPCVSTHHAGISEMIPRENHDLLAPEGDVETLSNCLFRLANFSADDLMQLAETGRRKVEREFNLSREVESLRDTYSRAVYSKSLN